MKKIVKRIVKVVLWVFFSIILLLVLVIVLIQVPAVQNFARKKIVAYLENKIHTKVEIRKLSISFPKQLVLEGVYLEDQQKDTLLAANKLQVDIAMLKLINSKVEIKYIGLDGVTANIKRLQPDSTFNFDYIIKAFTSGPVDTTTSSQPSSMTFQLGTIKLSNIRTTYHDDVTGNDAAFNLGNFETDIKAFDLAKNIYEIPDINVSGIRTSVRQYKPLIEPKPMAEVEAKSNEPFNLTLKLKNINFKDVQANYANDISALKAGINLGSLSTQIKNIDLATLLIQLDKVEMDSTSIIVALGKSQQAVVAKQEVQKQAVAQANNPWKLELNSLLLNHNRLQYDDDNKPRLKKGMDYSHLDITDLVFDADKLVFTPVEYTGAVEQFAFNEKSGLQLQKFSTQFSYNEKEAFLKDFVLKTNRSTITSQLSAKYPSVEALSKKPGEVYADINMDTFLLASKDILLLAPQMEPQLRAYNNAVLKAQLKRKGYIKDMRIDNFALSGYGATNLQMNGNIKGLPDGKNAYYDLKLDNFNTTKQDLTALLPKNSVPSSIRIPEKIAAKGFFRGMMKSFKSFISAKTSKGSADITADVSNNYKTYNVKAALKNVDVGYLTKQDTLVGKITLNATAKGTGTDYKTMNTAVHADLVEGEIKGYTYKHLLLDATLKKGAAELTSSINDSNLTYALNASANVAGKFPSDVKAELKLDTLNMSALHLLPDSSKLGLHSYLIADLPSANPDSLAGTVKIYDTRFLMDSLSIKTDTVQIAANNENNIQDISLQSEVANADFKGTYKLTEVATALQHTINQYYKLPGFKDTAFTAQNWQMNFLVKPASPLMLQFVPSLKGSDTITANVAFNSAENDLKINALAPHIQFGQQAIEQTSITAATNDKQLDYNIQLESAGSKGFKVYQTSLAGNVAGNILSTSLIFKDRAAKDKYHLAGKLQQVDSSGIKFSFNPDSLMLNYEPWQMLADNYIQYDTTGLIVHNFQLSKGGQSFGLNSTSESASAPIEATFQNFKIGTLTSFAEQDSLLVDGVIDGKAVVSNAMTSPVFTTDLTIKDLSYKKDTIGTIVAKVNNETANAYAANVSIKGKGNDIVLDGKYYTGEGKMDLNLDINNIDLATVAGLSAGQLKQAGGSLKGKVAIAGTTKQPDINGNLNFSNAFIVPTMLGERFSLPDEKINVTSKGINFDQFTLVDSSGNKAILDGDIITTDYTDFKFALTLKAKDFRLINSTKTDNPLFYGKLNMDADIKVGGDMTTPSVNAALKANKETNLTFVLPSSDPEVVSREGVVNFIDVDAPVDTTQKVDVVYKNPALAAMDIAATFETDTAAKFAMVIDERNGDAINIQGKADLAGGIDESGRLTLTGSYEVARGDYSLTLSVLKRKFLIQSGSVITWTGDPMSANVDITAQYQVNTAPIDLMQAQISNKSESNINQYKQKIPVQVLLKMKGELLKPVISFDITLDDETAAQWKDVETKIEQMRTDESEVNKQVFALLLLGRFVQENPFESAGGGTSNETMLKQSASRILTDQLNQLAGSLVKGVDLNFGLNAEDDYSTGQRASRTDLTVGVSKSLFSDRLRVNVGSNFELEGPANSNQQATNIAGDVAIDYQLSKDGRYLIRGYRKNKYEGVVEGQIIETGLTFVFTLDYDKFSELFSKKKKTEAKPKAKK